MGEYMGKTKQLSPFRRLLDLLVIDL